MLCAKCGIIQFMYIETHKKLKGFSDKQLCGKADPMGRGANNLRVVDIPRGERNAEIGCADLPLVFLRQGLKYGVSLVSDCIWWRCKCFRGSLGVLYYSNVVQLCVFILIQWEID